MVEIKDNTLIIDYQENPNIIIKYRDGSTISTSANTLRRKQEQTTQQNIDTETIIDQLNKQSQEINKLNCSIIDCGIKEYNKLHNRISKLRKKNNIASTMIANLKKENITLQLQLQQEKEMNKVLRHIPLSKKEKR